MNTYREKSEIQKDITSTRIVLGTLLDELNELEKYEQTICKHKNTKIVTRSYFEEGKMSDPLYWKERVCTKCRAVVATCHERVTEVWSDAK